MSRRDSTARLAWPALTRASVEARGAALSMSEVREVGIAVQDRHTEHYCDETRAQVLCQAAVGEGDADLASEYRSRRGKHAERASLAVSIQSSERSRPRGCRSDVPAPVADDDGADLFQEEFRMGHAATGI